MTDINRTPTPEVATIPDPETSPFAAPPIEGIPYEKGSEEDAAIRRVVRESQEDRESRRSNRISKSD